jgi:quercetin dioxygenase-like cupin family protein
MSEVNVKRWEIDQQPDEQTLRGLAEQSGLQPYRWSNGPGDAYAAHTHSYNKVIYVVRGSIVFGLPEYGEQISLEAGDRLDLPAHVVHDAVVGPKGVVCLEAHRH